jgi:tetratricopeptide (TPR) repeat protein
MARKAIHAPILYFFLFVLFAQTTLLADPGVKIREEPITLPTYKIAEPDSNPMFFEGEVYQGASKIIYPYPFLDGITDEKTDKTYTAVYLENEYIKISFLPELGGRLFTGLDKTNNYNFFYRQLVVKPALIGMLGAWISGGIEWCVLHHHRATTYMPVDHTIVENPNGSRTLWLGETELRHRIKWIIGATLFPGKSYMQITGKIYNRTPYQHSFLYWANVAVHANDNYQVMFPPSVCCAFYHAKNDFTHWPISNETYQGVDYRGVDLSWWKNHPEPVSFFAWDLQEDFSGGYDHGKNAGLVHVGNHHVLPSAKLWEFSPGPTGRLWDKILSDNNEPYAELMVGGFSDNQPDYSWLGPYEVKTWTQYWYPVRDIGGFKNANLDAAVNLEFIQPDKAKLGFNATSKYQNAKVVLKAKDKILFEQSLTIAPDKPFVADVNIPAGIKQTDLEAILLSSSGDQLISYRPLEKTYDPNLPGTVKAPPAPKDVNSVEELYLIGLRIMQFHNPTVDPLPYFEEALRRDPGDSRVNTALGLDYNKRGLYSEAEKKLQTAVERIVKNYTRPRNCEPYYQLGLALKAQGKFDQAYDNFYRATWDYAFHAPAYYQLAEISCIKGNFAQAVEHIDNSLSTNALNTKAKNLKVAALRKLGRLEQAGRIASDVLAADPIDFLATNELYLIAYAKGSTGESTKIINDLKKKMRDDPQSYIELACDYFNFGLYDDAVNVLERAARADKKPLSSYPMLYYWLGFLNQKRNDPNNAAKYYGLSAKMPLDLCFPFRNEEIDVLKAAAAHNPQDPHACYLLGNVLYDKQPQNAIKAWEKSADLDAGFPTVHRNLGWACYRAENNIPKAIAAYEKSIACNSKDPRVLAELDSLYGLAGVSLEKRLALLEANLDTVVKRDDCYTRYVTALVQLARYDDAIKCLSTRHFHSREGGGEVREVYLNAHLLRGQKNLAAKDCNHALADFLAASEFPENLEVGRPKLDRRSPQLNYFLAAAYETLGNADKAKEHYTKSALQQRTSDWPETLYYQGQSFAKLGQNDKAKQIFDKLIETADKKLAEGVAIDFFAKFGEKQTKEERLADAHYILALGYLGNAQKDRAKTELLKAIDLYPNHLWAKSQLAQLK